MRSKIMLACLLALAVPAAAQEPSYFAEIAPDGTVLRVIVADQDMIASGRFGSPANWKRTRLTDNGQAPKNFAAPGYKFDAARNAFVAPRPFPSWVLDDATATWRAPSPQPNGGNYFWQEPQARWCRRGTACDVR